MMNNLILASTSRERLSSWSEGVASFVSTSILMDELVTNKLNKLRDDVIKLKPQIMLLDYDLLDLDDSYSAVNLRRLCAETQVIILSGDISEELEWELLKAGIRGCCHNDINPELLNQVVLAVQHGELWIRRTLTSRLIDELGKTTAKNKAYRANLGLLNKLTQREYEIAARVGNGHSNKQIAQSCAITERTVKAHLTEVYLKLGVSDRLNLALFLSAEGGNNNMQADR